MIDNHLKLFKMIHMNAINLPAFANNTIMGRDSDASGSFDTIIGYNNKVEGDNNTVMGNNNNIEGNLNIIMGSSNFISGDNNIINAHNLILIGNNVIIHKIFKCKVVINNQLTYNILLFFYGDNKLINDVLKHFLGVLQHVIGGRYCYYHRDQFLYLN